MSFTIACSSCGAKLRVPDKAVGRTFKCPKCGNQVAVSGVTSSRVEPSRSPKTSEAPDDEPTEGEPKAVDERGFSNAAFILGVVSLVPSSIGLLISFFPCIGWFAVFPCILGLVLGAIGCAVALVYQKRGIAFPLAGSITALAGIATVVLWMTVCSGILGGIGAKGLQKAAEDAEQKRKDAGAAKKPLEVPQKDIKSLRLTATVTWTGPPGTRRIGLQHGDIGSIPAGDHTFNLAPDAPLPSVRVGQKVECVMEQRNGQWVVSQVSPVSPDKR